LINKEKRDGVATIRGVADVRALGRRVRIAALGGRGASACRRAGTLRRVGRVHLNRRTGVYGLRVRVPAGSGVLALRTRAAGKRVGNSAFVLR
jgi:hypothetical protein